MTDVTCASGVELLMDYLEGAPAAAGAARDLEAHVAACERCRAYIASYRATPRILRDATTAELPAGASGFAAGVPALGQEELKGRCSEASRPRGSPSVNTCLRRRVFTSKRTGSMVGEDAMKKTMLVGAAVVLGDFWLESAWAGGQQVTAQPSADGLLVVVRTFRCGTPSSFTVHGTAEGVVVGQRKTIPLTIERAAEEGVFTVARQWPAEGKPALVFSVEGSHAVSTIAELEPGATIRIARQKATFEKPTPADVQAVLASAAPGGSR